MPKKQSQEPRPNDRNPGSDQTPSDSYLKKKAFFASLLTVYGRKPVLEALQDPATRLFRLHLADSNKPAPILQQMLDIAEQQGAEVLYHDRKALSRISRNSKQDQGVAADLQCTGYRHYRDFLREPPPGAYRLLALDRITNPQNLGMIIRSACAGRIDGILLPEKGGAQIDSLVIKASAGTLFRAPILRCETLPEALGELRRAGADACALSSHARQRLGEAQTDKPCVYVLGNETEGVSQEAAQHCNRQVRIDMNNGVESLNVAVTAALIAFHGAL